MKVSVIIKALNEEANIARAVESALRAVAPYGGEVVVADSASTDRTVEIAMRYPVKVVQLEDGSERCCGIAPQLGYQHCSGEYVYILDGDMDLDAEFVKTAIDLLEADPHLAGVGGFVPEMRAVNLQFRGRMKRVQQYRAKEPKDAKCLSGGGIYRRSSIESVGYFSDRNLKAYEEYDLGARLHLKGWRLVHLPMHAADHYSYMLSTLGLLWHKLRGGAYVSQGQIIRAAVENGYAGHMFRDIFVLRLSAAIWLYWLAVLIALVASPHQAAVGGAALFGIVCGIILVASRHRSLYSGIFSIVNWHLSAFSAVLGFVMPRRSPTARIASRILQEPAPNSDNRMPAPGADRPDTFGAATKRIS